MTTLERVGVTPIVEKMVETRLRWFRHVDQIKSSQPHLVRLMSRIEIWYMIEHYGVVQSM